MLKYNSKINHYISRLVEDKTNIYTERKKNEKSYIGIIVFSAVLTFTVLQKNQNVLLFHANYR